MNLYSRISMTRIRLTWFSPNDNQSFEYIGELPVSLGRLEDNTIALSGVRVSRNHVRIEEEKGNLTLVDLDSSNGTLVNEKRIKNERMEIKDGARFVIDP